MCSKALAISLCACPSSQGKEADGRPLSLADLGQQLLPSACSSLLYN